MIQMTYSAILKVLDLRSIGRFNPYLSAAQNFENQSNWKQE